MANPQLENGYTRLANEIIEALMRTKLAPDEWRVLLCIIRRTYGFGKKYDRLAGFQIVQDTQLRKDVVSRALHTLGEKQLINREGKIIGLNKNYESWQNCQLMLAELSTKKLAKLPTELAELPTKVGSPLVTQKIKETIQKKIIKENKENINDWAVVKVGVTDGR